MIDPFRLRVFATLAECGSFSAAARALGISQPAVSQNVAELEKYAGARLLSRSRAGVTLTWKGRQFLAKAGEVLSAYRSLEESCKAPQTLLLCNVSHGGRRTNILVDRGYFADLDAPDDIRADRRIDASGLEIRPLMFDCEADLDRLPDSKSGTGFFSGTCHDFEDAVQIGERTGFRVMADLPYKERALFEEEASEHVRVLALPDMASMKQAELRHAFDFARKRSLFVRISLAGSKSAQDGFVKSFSLTPLRYLDSLGLLKRDVLLCRCSFLDEEEWGLASRRGVTVIHSPSFDLSSSGVRFPYEQALSSGVRVCLGGRGAALGEEIKAARLLSSMGHPAVSDGTLMLWSTKNGADAFGIDAGEIAYGKLADAVLALPGTADAPVEPSSVRYVFCRGQILFDFRSHHKFDEVA